MSKINEDNCVLDDEELRILKYAAVEFGQYQGKMNQAIVPKIVLKVQKLNEMMKELREMEDEAPTAYRLLYKEKQK